MLLLLCKILFVAQLVHSFGIGEKVTWRCGIRFTSLKDDNDDPLPYASISSVPKKQVIADLSSIEEEIPPQIPISPALAKLYETVEQLQQMAGSDAATIQLDHEEEQGDDDYDDDSAIISINSLIFDVTNSNNTKQYILAIMAVTDRVDEQALQETVNRAVCTAADVAEDDSNDASSSSGSSNMGVTIQLARQVEETCGFKAGSVPPFGFVKEPMVTVIDESLLSRGSSSASFNGGTFFVRGGGGLPDQSCIVDMDALLLLQQHTTVVVTAAIAVKQQKATAAVDHEKLLLLADTNDNDASSPLPTPKPFFAVEPPDDALASAALADKSNSSNSTLLRLEPVAVSFVGRIQRVRRVARELAFCDVVPPDDCTDNLNNDDTDDTQQHPGQQLPWRSGTTGEPMAVQLIAGATLCQTSRGNSGDDTTNTTAGIAQLAEGQLVHVQGRTNVQSLDSLRNWVEMRSLDIVVRSYQVLALEGANSATSTAVDQKTPKRQAVAPPAPLNPENCLRLKDLTKREGSSLSNPIIVDDMKSVKDFTKDLSTLLTSFRTKQQGDIASSTTALVGIDCEWRPSFMNPSSRDPQPVLLLQVCLHPLEKVYLFDLQTLLRPMMPPSQPMDKLEKQVSVCLGALFASKRLVKVGFQVVHDLRQLAASYPHVVTLHFYNSVLESSTLGKKAIRIARQGDSREATSSLSRMVDRFMLKELDKREQCSDWSSRPLSPVQIEYAALDAAVTPFIVDKILADMDAKIVGEKPELRRWENDSSFKKALSSCRFVFVDTMDPTAQRKLKAKRIVGEPLVVSQMWSTGDVPPKLPEPPTDVEGPYRDTSGILQVPSLSLSIDTAKLGSIIDSLIGERVGKSKDKCVLPFLQRPAAVLPEGAKLDFPQRSGFVEFQDGVALFVNMPTRGRGHQPRSYPNEWLDEGRMLTWFLRENDWKQGTSALASKLLNASRNVITLFVRMGGKNGEFLCCGRIRVEEETLPRSINGVDKTLEKSWTLVKLRLVLLDYKKLSPRADFQSLFVSGDDSNYYDN